MTTTVDDWYTCDIDRKELKALMGRSDAKGLVRFGGLIALTVAAGVLAYLSLGTAWVVPAFLLYGTVFAFSGAANHELNHGTVFRTRWLNRTAHWIVCFMAWFEPVYSSYQLARVRK